MKANEAPEKIYLNLGDLSEEEYDELDFHDLSEVTWSEDDVQGRNVEYVRKDAFIEKACRWIKENITNNPDANSVLVRNGCVTLDMLVDDFKNYMKGE